MFLIIYYYNKKKGTAIAGFFASVGLIGSIFGLTSGLVVLPCDLVTTTTNK
jgi:hypothetical protein